MVFSSIIFQLYFFPFLLIIYYLSPNKLKNWVLLAFSILFYAWGMPRFVFVILGTTIVDFILVYFMDRQNSKRKKKLFLILSLLINLGILFYFKYYDFFVENLNVLLNSLGIHEISFLKIALPIGISFYTFETITYVVDVYRGVHKPQRNFWDYQLYIIFFPKLIAGPIVRYHEIADQINNRFKASSIDNKLYGLYRFIIGLAKKIILANVVGEQADLIFNSDYQSLTSATAWIGALAYTFQIYFDFSGYSDMAIGLASMFDFVLPENFNAPYSAQSITDFWKKWHISLGNWMRTYLYIPLGGNKVKHKTRLYFNLCLVFLISGLWHGASWNFIIWGIYHGLFLVLERAFLAKWLSKSGKFISISYTFIVVLTGWVFFRIENLAEAFLFVKKMYLFDGSSTVSSFDTRFYVVALLCMFFSFLPSTKVGVAISSAFFDRIVYKWKKQMALAILFLILYLLSMSYVASTDFNPFIYFRF